MPTYQVQQCPTLFSKKKNKGKKFIWLTIIYLVIYSTEKGGILVSFVIFYCPWELTI